MCHLTHKQIILPGHSKHTLQTVCQVNTSHNNLTTVQIIKAIIGAINYEHM